MKTYTLRLFGFPILQLDVIGWDPVVEEEVMGEPESEYPPFQVEEPRVIFEGGV